MALTWGPLGAGWTFVLSLPPLPGSAAPDLASWAGRLPRPAPSGHPGRAQGTAPPQGWGGVRGQAGSGVLSQHRRLWNASGLLCDPYKVTVKETGILLDLPPSKAANLASERPSPAAEGRSPKTLPRPPARVACSRLCPWFAATSSFCRLWTQVSRSTGLTSLFSKTQLPGGRSGPLRSARSLTSP